jgi:hypothetical protein
MAKQESEDGHKLEKSTEYHITVTTGFSLNFNVNKAVHKHKNISLYWSNIFPYFPFSPPFVLFPTFFQNPRKYFCGFRLSERALFCIFVHRVFQDMAATAFGRYLLKAFGRYLLKAFGRYLLKQTLFTKKRTKSLEPFFRKSQKTAPNHVFRHTYLYKFNNFRIT